MAFAIESDEGHSCNVGAILHHRHVKENCRLATPHLCLYISIYIILVKPLVYETQRNGRRLTKKATLNTRIMCGKTVVTHLFAIDALCVSRNPPLEKSLDDEEVPYTVSLDLARRLASPNVNLYLVKVRRSHEEASGFIL